MWSHRIELYLIEFLHQTTTGIDPFLRELSCILLNFYIKPQLEIRHLLP